MKVVVLTTSYPRGADDVAGSFVRDQVKAVRAAGVEVEVISPVSFRHYGIAYGDGIPNNLRRAPWKLALVPLFLAGFTRAARRAAVDADVVHAHWLPSLLPALATRRPVVVELWGSDAELAGRAGPLARRLLRRAHAVVCPSPALAEVARGLGARDVRVIPGGVEIPALVADPEEPPHVLYVGRLSEEKGVRDLARAAPGLPLVVVGDGPLHDVLPGTIGFVPPAQVGAFYERSAVVVCPSHREGFGFVVHEAMAHGRPVVATRVGGLADAVDDGVTGLLVPPHDPGALRAALERLLADGGLRRRMGRAGRERARAHFSVAAATRALIALYSEVTD